MVQRTTQLKCADNSGAKSLNVVGIPKRGRSHYAYIGDVVVTSVRGASSTGSVKDHELVKALIVRTRKEKRRRDGSYIRFDDNAAIVLDDSGKMRGTKIFGPVAREIRDLGYTKVASTAPEVW
ncbi:MAG: 50S ribosomal protein L14 [bacterium]